MDATFDPSTVALYVKEIARTKIPCHSDRKQRLEAVSFTAYARERVIPWRPGQNTPHAMFWTHPSAMGSWKAPFGCI